MSRSLGRRPSSTTGRVAPTEPSSRSASSRTAASRSLVRGAHARRDDPLGVDQVDRTGVGSNGLEMANAREASGAPPIDGQDLGFGDSGRRLRGRGLGRLEPGQIQRGDRDEARGRRDFLLQPAAVDRLDEGEPSGQPPPAAPRGPEDRRAAADARPRRAHQRRQLAPRITVLDQHGDESTACRPSRAATAAASPGKSMSAVPRPGDEADQSASSAAASRMASAAKRTRAAPPRRRRRRPAARRPPEGPPRVGAAAVAVAHTRFPAM